MVNITNIAPNDYSQIQTLEHSDSSNSLVSNVALAFFSNLVIGKGKDYIEWIKTSPLFLQSFFSKEANDQYLILRTLKPAVEIFFAREGIKIPDEIKSELASAVSNFQERLKEEFAKPVGLRNISNFSLQEQYLLMMLVNGQPKGDLAKISNALKSELNFTVGSSEYHNINLVFRKELADAKKAVIA